MCVPFQSLKPASRRNNFFQYVTEIYRPSNSASLQYPRCVLFFPLGAPYKGSWGSRYVSLKDARIEPDGESLFFLSCRLREREREREEVRSREPAYELDQGMFWQELIVCLGSTTRVRAFLPPRERPPASFQVLRAIAYSLSLSLGLSAAILRQTDSFSNGTVLLCVPLLLEKICNICVAVVVVVVVGGGGALTACPLTHRQQAQTQIVGDREAAAVVEGGSHCPPP